MTDLMNDITQGIKEITEFCKSKWNEPLWPNGPTGETYYNGLSRRNPNGEPVGSYVEHVTTTEEAFEFLRTVQDLEEFDPAPDVKRKNCRYISGIATGRMFLNVLPLEDAISNGGVVLFRDGEHGKEIVMPVSDIGTDPFSTHMVTIILEGTMLATWHPGEPLAALKDDVGEPQISAKTAVKIVRE